MKRSIYLPILSFLLFGCLLFVSCNSNNGCSLSDEEVAFFEAEIAKSQEVWNSGDREGYASRYSDASIFMIPNAEKLEGKDAILDFLNTFPDVKVEFEVVEQLGSCNLAAVRGTYQLTLPDGALADKGKWLEVWQKSDGQWELTRDIFNSDLPLPEVGEEDGHDNDKEDDD